MTRMSKLLASSPRIACRRLRTYLLQRGISQWPVVIWLGASCVLVVLLGTMQLSWIQRVDDSQDAAKQTQLRGAARLVVAQLHEEMLLLLTTFNPGADLEPTWRRDLYTQRFQSWHQTATYGDVVKRVLFLDLHHRRWEALTELIDGSFTVERAQLDKDLAPVHKHIDKFGSKPGRTVTKKGLVRWMLIPHPPTVYRAIAIPRRVPGQPDIVRAVTGYLVLPLDLDVISNQLIPKVLDNNLGELTSGIPPKVTIALDDEVFLAYEPSGNVQVEPRSDRVDAVGYSPRPVPGPDASGRAGSFDQAVPLLLSSGSVPAPAHRLGASQQIALRSPIDFLRVIDANPRPLGLKADSGLKQLDADHLFNTPLTVSMGLPRLFLVSDRPHRLTLQVGASGTALEEANYSEYLRSVPIRTLVLVLLVGSIAMVAVSGLSAIRQAEVRMEAIASHSHHLRTPLTAITALADNLAGKRLPPDKEVTDYFGLIRDYSQRLHEIVHSTVQLAAIESSQRRKQLTLVDVSTEAWNALEESRPIIRDAGFTVESSFAEHLPHVRADAVALRLCVGELLHNAVKYGLPGRWAKVETCEARTGRKREVRIRVHDRGQGVAREEARKIFLPYYRARAVVSSSIGGSGLGLNMVQSSVKEMNGQLTLESVKGEGSVFTIHLPVPC